MFHNDADGELLRRADRQISADIALSDNGNTITKYSCLSSMIASGHQDEQNSCQNRVVTSFFRQ